MMSNDSELRNIAYKKIKVNDQYRFFNANYCFNNNAIPFLKHDVIVERVKNRIKFSNGASFLITGLRGVGKSTIVRRVLEELKTEQTYYVPVYINLAKNIEYRDLLFEIVRRLYEALIDMQLFRKLDRASANNIVVSYSRTSMSICNKSVMNSEIESSVSNTNILGNILVKNKLTQQAAEEATFLAYSSNDVEHDLIRIIELLSDEKNYRTSNKKAKVVIVFDELDKLTVDEAGEKYFEDILNKLKSILCSISAISIFIGGLDLYEKWNTDTAKINSLYDSIFNWHQYIPCIWDSTESLFKLILEKEYIYEPLREEYCFLCQDQYTRLIKPSFKAWLTYINFKSKGIPRKIYSEFNNFIVWINGMPYFRISEIAVNEISAYAAIWKKIYPIFEDKLYKTVIEMDLTYVVCFNMIEYFFAHADEKFTVEQIQNSLLYDSTLSPINVSQILADLIKKFIEQHIIKEMGTGLYSVTDLSIRCDESIAIKDKSLYHNSGEEMNFSNINFSKEYDVKASFKRKIERYHLEDIISFWNCFEAEELILSNSDMFIFYVKNINSRKHFNAVLYTERQNRRLRNKNCLYDEAVYKLTSKYLLNTTDVIVDSTIKTSLREIYNGYLLSHIIESGIEMKYILLIIEQLLEFVKEINEQGYFNANIKSGNIMINQFLNVKILDVKNLIRIGSKGIPIASLGYAAPEMYTDQYDKRSDIYSIGVLLFEMVVRQCISKMRFERHVEFESFHKPHYCSAQIWNMIRKATRDDPAERYQDTEEFLKELRRSREYRKNRLMVNADISKGTVTNLYISYMNVKPVPAPSTMTGLLISKPNVAAMGTTILSEQSKSTVILNSGAEEMQKAYLVRTVTNEMISIDKPVFRIGKEQKRVDFCISDNQSISRIHASIIMKNNRFYIMDENSTNYTSLNGIRLAPKQEAEIRDGDSVMFSNEEFIFRQR